MSIIVTGGSGLLGSAFKKILPDAIYPTHKELDLTNSRDTLKYFDRFNEFSVSKIDAVIHLAGKVGGIKANTKYVSDFYHTNSEINNNVIESCIYTDVPKLVCCLSTCIYPDEKYVTYPLTEDQLHNGPPHDSNFGYAYAKRMVDIQLKAANQQYSTEYFSVIPNNMYGEHDNFNLDDGHVVPSLMRKIWEAKLNNKPSFEVWGDGEVYREFTYAEDIAKAIKLLIDMDYSGGPVNIGNSTEHELKYVISLLCKFLEYKGEIIFDASKPKGQIRKPSSNKKFLDLCNGQFQYISIEEGLKKTCEWFKDTYPNIRGA